MRNYLSFRQLDFKCLELAGLTDNDIDPATRQFIVNDLQYKIYGLLDGVNHPAWNTVVTLTVAADQEHLKDATTNGGTITAINSTTKSIARSAGVFPAGAILDIVVVKIADNLVAGQWKARVSVAGATATYVKVGTGTEVTFDNSLHVCFVNVMNKLSATAASLEDSFVKDVVKVFDDQATGSKERVFELKTDARAFGDMHRNPLKAGVIGAYRRGDSVEFFVGAGATALGVVQAEVITKPGLYSDATADNAMNIPPEENQMLTDMVVAEYLKKVGKPTPADLQGRLALIQQRFAAAEADRIKALEVKQSGNK